MTGCCLRVSRFIMMLNTLMQLMMMMELMTVLMVMMLLVMLLIMTMAMMESLQDGVMYKPGARFYDEATDSTLVIFLHC